MLKPTKTRLASSSALSTVFLSVGFLLVTVVLSGQDWYEMTYDKNDICLTSEERRMLENINQYRDEMGLPGIGFSRSLTFVARMHARDLHHNYNHNSKRCNMHSWSDSGPWTPCCYTRNHRRAECMWFKPRELTGYEGIGYEIVYYTTYPEEMKNMGKASVDGWKQSLSHLRIIINRGMWKDMKWKAMGAGIFGNYAVVWFGDQTDPDGSPGTCFD